MSVKVMGLVWEAQGLKSSEKLVLLAYADHAGHDGTGIWPAVETIAFKTSLHRRTVQRTTRILEEKGYMIQDGNHDSGTNMWKIPLDIGGGVVTPPGRRSATGGVTLDTQRGGVVTPKPSLTINEPSLEPSEEEGNIFLLYESSIGLLTKNISDELKTLEDDYPKMWIDDAFAIAKKNKAKSLKYVTSILTRWNTNGKDDGYKPKGKKKGVDTSAFDRVREEMKREQS